MQNNQGIMQISENKDGSAKVLFRIRKAEMADVDEIMAVMHEAKNDKEHPDWFVSDDEEYVRTHIEEQGFVIVAQTADGSVAGFFLIKYPENREDNLGTYLDFDEEHSEKPYLLRSSNWNRSPKIWAQLPLFISSIIRYCFLPDPSIFHAST